MPDGAEGGLDLTVASIPLYFATMGAEYWYLRRRSARGETSPGDYEWRDTLASLSMGLGSLVAPLVMPKIVGRFTPGVGRYGRALVGVALGAAAVVTAADIASRSSSPPGELPAAPLARAPAPAAPAPALRAVGSAAAVTAVSAGVLAASTSWAARTTTQRLWERRIGRDRGRGLAALAGAVLAWDFVYYWNHRLQHESRFMWAIHVVHHSSERYNLSTALRQPVADVAGTFVPIGLLSLFGIRPALVESARGINLLYQYWIHTVTIPKLGVLEEVFNTPSHHRVHHGSNRRYLDRNHGSILIIWDRIFGTFQREDEQEPVVYGLTRNIDTFNPARIAAHEHSEMLRDVARSRAWRDRLSAVVRGPGWSYRRWATI